MTSSNEATVRAFLQAHPSHAGVHPGPPGDTAMEVESRLCRPHCDPSGKVYSVLATNNERPNLMGTTYRREPILRLKSDRRLPATIGGRRVRWREHTGGTGIHGYVGFDRYLTHRDLQDWSDADFAELVRSAPPA